jgi:hypothetical protein
VDFLLGALGATAVWAVTSIFMSGPLVKDVAGPIATVFAAAMAGWIAYRIGNSQVAVARTQAEIAEKNWKTSNEKIVLDLFDKRLAIFEDIRAVIGEVVRSGGASDDLLFRYDKAIDRVSYFFGEEVQRYLRELRLQLIDLNLAITMMAANDPDRHKWITKKYEHLKTITKFYEEHPSLFGPYMKAHQKV